MTTDNEWVDFVEDDEEPELRSYEYAVYCYIEDSAEAPDLDDVIEAGIKALGVEDKFQFVESDIRDSGHF